MAIPDGGHYVATVNPVSLWLYLMVAAMLPQWTLFRLHTVTAGNET